MAWLWLGSHTTEYHGGLNLLHGARNARSGVSDAVLVDEALLALLARQARTAQDWTQTDLAARIGVTQKTMHAIEIGLPSVSIGSVFNAAFTVGVNLFGLDGPELARARRQGEDTLALLPLRVRRPVTKDDVDAFDF